MHAAYAVSSPLSIISPGDVGGDGGVTDASSYKRSLFSRITIRVGAWGLGSGDSGRPLSYLKILRAGSGLSAGWS